MKNCVEAAEQPHSGATTYSPFQILITARFSPMRAPVRLISTDFDGTLVEHGNPAPFSPLLVEILTTLRGRGVRWAINTGRTLPWLVDGLQAFSLPIQPYFAITA